MHVNRRAKGDKKMARGRLAYIQYVDGPDGGGDPGYDRPSFGGGRPDNSLPGSGGRPDNSLPGGGHISTLPVFPFDPTKPDNELPGGGGGSTLPIRPGAKFVVKWLACHGLILVPDNSLPSGGVKPDNELPETGEPK
jgi:hypothetical protein